MFGPWQWTVWISRDAAVCLQKEKKIRTQILWYALLSQALFWPISEKKVIMFKWQRRFLTAKPGAICCTWLSHRPETARKKWCIVNGVWCLFVIWELLRFFSSFLLTVSLHCRCIFHLVNICVIYVNTVAAATYTDRIKHALSSYKPSMYSIHYSHL